MYAESYSPIIINAACRSDNIIIGITACVNFRIVEDKLNRIQAIFQIKFQDCKSALM